MLNGISIGLINILIILLLSPLYEGVMRKVRAVLHSRQGPPLLQPYYDLAKLMLKDDQEVAGDFLFKLSPVCVWRVTSCSFIYTHGTPLLWALPRRPGAGLLLTMSAVFYYPANGFRQSLRFPGANRK
jgi:formate hydrogenlyase subunit 4